MREYPSFVTDVSILVQACFDLFHEMEVQTRDMYKLYSNKSRMEGHVLVVDRNSWVAEQAIRVEEQSHRSVLDGMSW